MNQQTVEFAPAASFVIESAKHVEMPAGDTLQPESTFKLGRFTYIRQHDDRLIVESPLSEITVSTATPLAARVVFELATGAAIATIGQDLPADCMPRLKSLIALLHKHQLVRLTHETEPDHTATWEFHDLLFHHKSRVSDPKKEFATFRFRQSFKPQPPFKSAVSAETISLKTPDLAELSSSDLPFTKVLEARRSRRDIGPKPITLDQLAEFLYRTTHVQHVNEQDEMQRMLRPYPSGGGVHELEFYMVVNRCPQLERGIYHYNPQQHLLYRVQSTEQQLERLFSRTAFACAIQHYPDVLVVLTARFGRLAYKYESIAYRLMLLHVGVVFQTMYLVATAMQLNPCAVGSGWLRWLEDNAGHSWLEEDAVGEFMLSSGAERDVANT